MTIQVGFRKELTRVFKLDNARAFDYMLNYALRDITINITSTHLAQHKLIIKLPSLTHSLVDHRR